jgi:preprotein translocase subunit SecA
VMNEQRRVVYKYRREILEGRDMSDVARTELAGTVERLFETYAPGEIFEDWDLAELQTQVSQLWPSQLDFASLTPEAVDREDLSEQLVADALAAYDRREQQFGGELMRELERAILLQIIDNRWREHLYEMDYLREGIHLRGFAQIDPLVAYKNEGYNMFSALMYAIWEEFSKLIFHVEVNVEPSQAQAAFAPSGAEARNVTYTGGGPDQPSALTGDSPDMVDTDVPEAAQAQGNGGGEAPPAHVETVVKDEHDNIGRNDPCWCGSGKKYKKCHGA